MREKDVEPIVNLPELLAGIYDRAGCDYRLDYDRDPVRNFSPKVIGHSKILGKLSIEIR
ncbi:MULTISPECIES: hypothetical protein [unclassified Microcoleus]|uniref:hypothetical protein n=1 Tax=unclassified Microcoleus TaxID=2642155 RepID=UPI00403F9C4D